MSRKENPHVVEKLLSATPNENLSLHNILHFTALWGNAPFTVCGSQSIFQAKWFTFEFYLTHRHGWLTYLK